MEKIKSFSSDKVGAVNHKAIALIFIIMLMSVFGFSQTFTNGNAMFDNTTVHQINVTFSIPNFFDTLESHYNTAENKYIMCNVNIDGVSLDSVGMKEKGYWSNIGMGMPGYGGTGKKRPFKINLSEFISNRKYDGLKKINLANGFDDPSMMRDALSNKILRDAGLPAPRTSYGKLYINGTYWGLYNLIEEVDKNFLEDRMPDKSGNLYKALNTDLAWEGNLKADYVDNFEQSLKNSGDTSFTDLIHLHDVLNNSGSNFKDSVLANFSTANFFKSMAVDYLVDNFDNLLYHNRNFFLYHSTTDNKFYWIPWDYSYAFSATPVIDLLGTTVANNFWNQCMAEPSFKAEYLSYVCSINQNLFSNAQLDSYLDNLKLLIRNDLDNDPNKFFSITEFDNNINTDITGASGAFYEGIKSGIAARHNLALSELASAGYTCTVGVSENGLANEEVLIYPNPSSTSFTIELNQNKVRDVQIFNTLGEQIAFSENVENKMHLNTESWTRGIYLVKIITTDNKQLIEKVVIQ